MKISAWLYPGYPAFGTMKASYTAYGDVFDEIYPMHGGACTAAGTWTRDLGLVDLDIKTLAASRGQPYMPGVWATSGADFQTVLDDAGLWDLAISNLLTLALDNTLDGPWDGVMFNIEGVSDTYRDKYTDWMEEACGELHTNGLLAAISAFIGDRDSGPNWEQRTFDHAALSAACDSYVGMHYRSYEMNPDTAPGPYALVDRELSYLTGLADNSKCRAGLTICPKYWDAGSPLFKTYLAALAILAAAGETATWYEVGEDGQRFAFKRAAWDTKEMWLVDSETLSEHLGLADKYHIGGICLFTPGDEDSTIWSAIDRWLQPAAQVSARRASRRARTTNWREFVR